MTRPSPSFVQAAFWMAAHYRRTIFRGRKVIVVCLLLGVGLVLAASVGTLEGARRAAGYEAVMRQLTLGFLAQFVALFYGIAVVREEVESRTLTYLFVRPLPRASILLGRWFAATLIVTAVVLGYALAAHLLTVPDALVSTAPEQRLLEFLSGEGAAATLAPPGLAAVAVAASLSAAYYTTIFTAIAVVLRRPFLFGLGYIIFWEAALPMVPNAVSTLSLKFHTANLLGLPPANPLPIFEPPHVAPFTSLLVLVIATAVFLGLALYAFPRREYITARAE